MDTMLVLAFSLAAIASSISLFAFTKIEKLEKRMNDLEGK